MNCGTEEQLNVTNGRSDKIAVLCGGVGGAKLALGLASVLPAGAVTLIVNTGDDFAHLALHISPDIDTVVYTLAGLVDPERGWGRADETWNFMSELERFGLETWFKLGDRDLVMHVERTRSLRRGETLTSLTARMAQSLGVTSHILPMSDDPVRTVLRTDEGDMEFQRYFVERRCAPVVRSIRFAGASESRPTAAVTAALSDPGLDALIICPSNPYLSIDPILAVPGLRDQIAGLSVPRIAVSPLVGGDAVKGPTRKIMIELGLEVTHATIAAHYRGLVDGLVIHADDGGIDDVGMAQRLAPTLMRSFDDKRRLAGEVLEFAQCLRSARHDMRRSGR